ncbi:hypothetical protein ONZ45_g8111 [Pleurotus djamor]|nr:hypothetical protein ONZ45_g8111 [Pleurotus djamor]
MHSHSSLLTPRRVVVLGLTALIPTVSAEEVCDTRFGVTKCRSRETLYIKLGIAAGIVFLCFVALLVYYLVKRRRKRELDDLVSGMEPSQIQGALPTTYRSPPPVINVMGEVPSPAIAWPPYSASPYGYDRHPYHGGVPNSNGNRGWAGDQPMMFAGPTGTPHYPNSAYGEAQHQQPKINPVSRRRSTDDMKTLSPHGEYPFKGYSSQNPPADSPSTSSHIARSPA